MCIWRGQWYLLGAVRSAMIYGRARNKTVFVLCRQWKTTIYRRTIDLESCASVRHPEDLPWLLRRKKRNLCEVCPFFQDAYTNLIHCCFWVFEISCYFFVWWNRILLYKYSEFESNKIICIKKLIIYYRSSDLIQSPIQPCYLSYEIKKIANWTSLWYLIYLCDFLNKKNIEMGHAS